MRELGLHTDGEPIRLYQGRFGPYLKHGAVNANIPRGEDPAAITLEQAIAIVNVRAMAPPSTKARGKGRAGKAAPASKAESGAKKPAKSEAKEPKAAKTKAKPAKASARKAPAARKAGSPTKKA